MRKALWIGLALFIILILVYYQLGGFNQLEIQMAETNNYHLAGYYYEGPFEEMDLKKKFFQMQEYVENGKVIGTVSVVNYEVAPSREDSVKQFIGINLEKHAQQLPENLQQDTIYAQQVMRAIIRAHPIVMPNPYEVLDMIKSKASEEGIALESYSIEQYVSENEIWVDIPLSIVMD